MEKLQVLLAEDYLPIRQAIGQMLARHPNITVIAEVETGEEAIERTERAAPDLVLLDISLPGINGIEATRTIKRKSPDTGVIVLTEQDDKEYTAAALEAGASACLKKESLAEMLIPAIFQWGKAKEKQFAT